MNPASIVVSVAQPGPVKDLFSGEYSAVWPGDKLMLIRRVGSHRLCLVTYGSKGYERTIAAHIPKRWLRFRLEAAKGGL